MTSATVDVKLKSTSTDDKNSIHRYNKTDCRVYGLNIIQDAHV